jgi:hypothetical protein
VQKPAACSGALRAGALALLLSGSGACKVVGSNVWNLDQLHDDTSRHQYRAALQSDTEYFLRNALARTVESAGADIADKAPKAVEDPAAECLENLVELESFDMSDPRVAAQQVEWFARLAREDPWKLSRERAVLVLGRAGKRLQAGVPLGLRDDVTPVGPEELATALGELVECVRPGGFARAASVAVAQLDAACRRIEAMTLDVDGARRALRIVGELCRVVGLYGEGSALLVRLNEHLQRVCVRQALAGALLDPEPIVRAMAVQASVASGGKTVLDLVLRQLGKETSPVVLVRIMHLVRDLGLPEVPPDVAPEDRDRVREAWLAQIYGLLTKAPDGAVRVSAMQALSRVSGAGLVSLREEDWQQWWESFRSDGGVLPDEGRGG